MTKHELIELLQQYHTFITSCNQTKNYPISLAEFELSLEQEPTPLKEGCVSLMEILNALTGSELEKLGEDYSDFVLSTYDNHYDEFHDRE